MQKGGFVPKSDVKQNANSGNLDKTLHFLALIFARIFVFESTFCKNNDTKFNSIDKHLRLQIVAMLLVGLSIMLIFSISFCSGWFYCSWLIEGVVASNKRDGGCSLCRIEAKHKFANARAVWGNGCSLPARHY